MVEKCTALQREILNDSGSVTFKCPQCLKATIVRSTDARKIMVRYTCPECGFTGPN